MATKDFQYLMLELTILTSIGVLFHNTNKKIQIQMNNFIITNSYLQTKRDFNRLFSLGSQKNPAFYLDLQVKFTDYNFHKKGKHTVA